MKVWLPIPSSPLPTLLAGGLIFDRTKSLFENRARSEKDSPAAAN
jgi:hypothetical protein